MMKSFLLVLFCSFAMLTQAQQPTGKRSISGIVHDANNLPLVGATIKSTRTNQGVVSDDSGKFIITALSNDTLVVDYVGYTTQRVPVLDKTILNITLIKNNIGDLNDVVVIGYGSVEKKNLTTAVASVDAKKLTEQSSTTNIIQGLQGKVAGVSIFQNSGKPGGSPTIRIRGTGSINASNDPLYVIDGIVGADPNTIDPNIVASVDVLKDAAASAIYGARGANGVVIITTKEGSKGSSVISFNHTSSISSLERELKLLDANGALEMIKRQYAYSDKLPPNLDPDNDFARKSELFNADGSPKYNTDWQKEATRSAYSTNNSLSFSGGNQKMSVLANVSYKNQQGIMLNSYQKQINGYLNIGWDVKPWLHLQANINGGAYEGNNVELNTLGLNAIRETYEFLPFLPVTYADGTYSRKGDYPGAENSENPVKLLNDIKDIQGNIYAQSSFIATVHFSNKLDFTTSWGGQYAGPYENYYAGKTVFGVSETQNGVAQRTNGTNAGWTNEEYFTYNTDFGKNQLNVVAGASWYYNVSSSTKAGSENFFDDYFTYNSLQTGTVLEQPNSSKIEYQLNSYYLRPTYNYDNRYIISGSLRADGSSRFGKNNKYGTFYSLSGAWRLSNEAFFKPALNAVNDLKLRVSYGVVGNSEIGNYATLNQLSSQVAVFNGSAAAGVILTNLGNNDLKWERQNQFDVGIDGSFLHNRISFTGDYYSKKTTDLLYLKQLPATTGYQSTWDNIGSIRNRGIELAITTKNIVSDNFDWTTTLNYSMNRSKVLDIHGDILSEWAGRIEEGRSLDEFYGYTRIGTWGSNEQQEAAKYGRKPGDVKYLDRNNDGAINADDQLYLGHKLPRYEANFTSTLRYKQFSLFVDVQTMQGNKIMDFSRFITEGDNPNVNTYTSILNAWTPDHQNTRLGALRTTVEQNSAMGIDNFTIQDGSFVRIRNIGLNYSFPEKLLQQWKLQKLSVGIQAENYFLFTKYTGYDPEISSFGGGLNQGVDVYGYPKPKIIALNLNLTF
ncbi:TonB-dependent receptor [Arachidicoccus ginsenosidivorans]|uniref:TonB-dependent receptor n=1 Tax=Arachidicoccus ginsenosidivorans TaxID=496057 RepID=A0A5B8VPH0_9BACT|nr:TonB-dependent receptor [Arachidicoccus ginsenosidivorans]QEC73527.1 TonB-dependent receptor [Arachidicoccus ginsenosidivorans]